MDEFTGKVIESVEEKWYHGYVNFIVINFTDGTHLEIDANVYDYGDLAGMDMELIGEPVKEKEINYIRVK